MKRIRVIPALLLEKTNLVKTFRFKERKYIGDPINTVKILNDKEVDELVILDILASKNNTPPNINYITELASECFMPLAYGGGVTSLKHIKDILNAGIEKVIINTAFFNQPELIQQAASIYGNQSIVVSLDIKKKTFFKGHQLFTLGGTKKIKLNLLDAAQKAVDLGAGEILLNNIDRDGTMQGYDTALIQQVSEHVSVPVIACGGASSTKDFVSAIKQGKASAVAAGALFVFKGPHKAVLINYPSQQQLQKDVYRHL